MNNKRNGPMPKPPEIRFWNHVIPGRQDECWEWTGTVEVCGYGYLRIGGRIAPKQLKAHRLSWEIHNKQAVPEGLCVLHKCDNPPCVNPAHLYLGTHQQNMRDRATRKRGKEHRQNGEANDNSKLTEVQVREIIAALQSTQKPSQQALADRFGIKQPQVSRIARRESWAHLWSE